jgi:hypothetical protein
MDIAVERTLSVSQARLLCIVLLFAFPLFAQSTASSDVGKQWWEHVKVIADDKNEGRETGSPGMQRAADYVVKTLKANGISPAGSNGYYQPVRLIQRSLDESQSSITLVHDNKDEPIKLGDEAYFSTRVDLAPSVNAKLVFVGYGLKVPEADYDDLAGQDLRGKVVVYISGAPSSVPPDLVSHYQSAGERWKALGTAGAIGAIGIPNPAAMDIPWSRLMVSRLHPSMRLADDSLLETKGWQLLVTWNPESADKLLAGSGHTAAELFALVKDKKPLPCFELPASLKATTKLEYKNIDSYNIVAKLPGSDSKLKAENVVLSAHLDHIGIGEPINGDRLYNGAMDNGSGAAMMLEVSDRLKQEKAKPKRSLLFVFVTAEEKGLLGSRYFVSHPTVPKDSIVADINMDMFLPINPPKSIIVRGMNESTLGAEAREAVEAAGAKAQADPEPQRNSFIRSDQYNFIRDGIPAVVMSIGYEPGSPEEKVVHEWLKNRYHAPSDDLDQPVNLEAAAKYEQIVEQLMLRAADAADSPKWNDNSFFKRFEVQRSGSN